MIIQHADLLRNFNCYMVLAHLQQDVKHFVFKSRHSENPADPLHIQRRHAKLHLHRPLEQLRLTARQNPAEFGAGLGKEGRGVDGRGVFEGDELAVVLGKDGLPTVISFRRRLTAVS